MAKQIHELPASNSAADTDYFVKDTGSQTQKITFENLRGAVLGNNLISFEIPVGQTATVDFSSTGVAMLLATRGQLHGGFGTLSYMAGYVSGSRLSNNVIVDDPQQFVNINVTDNSNPRFTISSSATNAPMVVILFILSGSITNITVA